MSRVNAPVGRQQVAEVVEVVTARIVCSAGDQAAFECLLNCLLSEVTRLAGRHILVKETYECGAQVLFGETEPA